MNEELNRKLAERAGFSVRQEYDGGFHLFKTPQKLDPDGIHYDEVEFEENWYSGFHTDFFTSSLDAIFKWLVPPLNSQGIGVTVGQDSLGGAYACVFNPWADDVIASVDGQETPALALCKAIEQVIDGEANGG